MLLAAILSLAQAGSVQDLESLVRASAYEVRAADGGFSGPGFDFMVGEGERSRFFVIGESHGNRETPLLTNALLPALRAKGYGAYAIETGPLSTRLLVDRVRRDGPGAIADLMEETPFSIAFLNWREEGDAVGAALAHGYDVWGIDQEFIASGRLLTARLVDIAQDDAARRLSEEWHERALEGFRAFTEGGPRSKGFMSVVTEADFDTLQAAFEGGPAEAREILSALRASAAIYRHYEEQRYYLNNRDRIRLMKGYLVERLDRSPGARVLIKLGSAHAGRGYSPYDQLDVGNLAAELAFASGSDSFHLYVLARRSLRPDGSSTDFMQSSPELGPFYDRGGAEPLLFDLRELRAWASARRESDAALHSVVFRFDALLLLPEFHAAEELVPMPDGDR